MGRNRVAQQLSCGLNHWSMFLLLCIRVKLLLWKRKRMILLWKGRMEAAAFWRPGAECVFAFVLWSDDLSLPQRVYQQRPSWGGGQQPEVGGETWRGWEEACGAAKTEPRPFLVLWFRAAVEPGPFLGGDSVVEPREKCTHPQPPFSFFCLVVLFFGGGCLGFFLLFLCQVVQVKFTGGYLSDLGAKEGQEDSPLHLNSR